MMAYSTEETNKKVDKEFDKVILHAVKAFRDGHIATLKMYTVGGREMLVAKRMVTDERIVLGKGEPTGILIKVIDSLYEKSIHIGSPEDIAYLPDGVPLKVIMRNGTALDCVKDTLYRGHPEEVGIVVWTTPEGDVKILDIINLAGATVKIR